MCTFINSKKLLILLFMLNLISLTGCSKNTTQIDWKDDNLKIEIKVNNYTLTATLINSTSSKTLLEYLKVSDLVVETSDYGNFEKVGQLPFNLPKNDSIITAKPGDIILYQGDSICFYYETNTWSFTKLGGIDNVCNFNLKDIYGNGNTRFYISMIK